ncbi:MAG TPA: isoprenylcysteine carboxylmethyltransferase family protein [Anaerolineales bacterium]
MHKLTLQALMGLAQLVLILAIFLFLPGWSLNYWQAWVFLFVFSLSVLLVTLYFLKNDPRLIESRIKAGPGAEQEKSQKIIQTLASIFFILPFIISSIDHRLGWSDMPPYLVLLGDILVALGLFIVFLVFRENSFTSATIEVREEQKVIATGPYAIVRHPMYAGAFIMLLGVPLALGSWWAFIFVFLLFGAIVWRLFEEENFLSKNLPGYTSYRQKVRYRLIPFIW